MKNWMVVCMALLCGGFGWVQAGTLTRTLAWAERTKPEEVRSRVARLGVSSDEDFARVAVSWSENAVVDFALEKGRIDLLAWVLERDTLSAQNVLRVLAHQRELERPHDSLWSFVARLPRIQRGQFEEVLVKLVPHRFGDRPVYGSLELKYQVLRGASPLTGQTETGDLVALLLAPERLDLRSAERLKESIKWNAVRLARVQLRDEGLSFVAVDGVNPLEERVRPVVEALNVPLAAGLEDALRGLGGDVQSLDRTPLRQQADAWRERILLGDFNSRDAGAVLGKLSIGLGVEGFNEFVDVYNHGTRGADREGE